MATTVGDINVEIGAKLTKLQKGIDQANKELGKLKKGQRDVGGSSDALTKKFGQLGKAIAGAFAVREIIKFGQQAVRLAGQMQGVEAGFERLGGTPELMDRLTRATRGTVSELQLMQAAVQAGNFGIEMEALPQLLEFASRRAQETGQSVDYLVDSIVTGIGRKSPLILDNLGISAVALKEELGGVSLEASNIGDVSQAVGAIATRELEKMGETTVTTTDKIAQASSAFENMQIAIGQRLSGAVETAAGNFGGLFQVIADLVAIKPSEEFRNQSIELKTLSRQILDTTTDEETRKKLIEEVQRLYPQYLSNIDAEKTSYEQLEGALRSANQELENKTLLSSISEDYKDAANSVAEYTRLVEEYEGKAQRQATILEELSGESIKAGESLKDYNERIREAGLVSTYAWSESSKLSAILSRQAGYAWGLSLAQQELNTETERLNRTRERLGMALGQEATATEIATETASAYSEMLRSGSITADQFKATIEGQRQALASLDMTQEDSASKHEELFELVKALDKVYNDYEASLNTSTQATEGNTQAVDAQAQSVNALYARLERTYNLLRDFKEGELFGGVDFQAVADELKEVEILPEFDFPEGGEAFLENLQKSRLKAQELADVLSTMYGISNEEALAAAENIGMTAEQFTLASNAAYGFAASMQAALIDTMANGEDFGKAMIDFLKNLVFRLVAAAAAAAALASILTVISGGATGFGKAFLGGFGQLSGLGGMLSLDGARASGGPVMAGGSYLVGEEGPEIFTPSTSGMILPNSALSAVSTPTAMAIPVSGGSQSITVRVEGEISGDNIRLVGENATQRNDRRQRG